MRSIVQESHILRSHAVFQNPHTGTFQQSRQLRNVYYHAQKTCVSFVFPGFTTTVSVKCDVKSRSALCPQHKNHLLLEFGFVV